MADRYANRRLLKNDMEMYSKLFEDRGVNFISQYASAAFNYPNSNDIGNLQNIQHIWKTGDRYYKLASKYYGEPTYWWVIALYNKTPTEAHLRLGDVIDIPVPLETVLSYF
jgi:nucleoid-associated protein YgaU